MRSRLLRRAPEVRSAPGEAGASPSRGGLMVWGWWGRVGKERERRGEPPPGWSGGMRSPGARRGDRALSPVLEPRRQKWLRVGARCWSWASSVPQPPPGHCLSMAQGGLGAPDSPRWVGSWNSPIAFLGIASLLGLRGLLNASLERSTRCLPAYRALI